MINETSGFFHFKNNVRMFYVNTNSCGVYVQEKVCVGPKGWTADTLNCKPNSCFCVLYSTQDSFFNYQNTSPNTEI